MDYENNPKLYEKFIGHKIYVFYFRFFNKVENKYCYAILDTDGGDAQQLSYEDKYNKQLSSSGFTHPEIVPFQDQFLNPEDFEQLKKDLGVNEITEVICFADSVESDIGYYNTDKGEFIYDGISDGPRKDNYKTLDKYIDASYKYLVDKYGKYPY